MCIHRSHRIIAVLLMQLFVLDILYPTLSFALTGGPSQPEFESFEPISTDQMVDLFTGDFNYNIPLMSVPGPNGGYPINLAYHAGIGMEQEASWVGLGWNVNVGEINRMVRGLPDDFNGDQVTTTTNMRPNNTYGLSIGTPDFEILGLDPGVTNISGKATMYLNDYRGVGIRANAQYSTLTEEQIQAKMASGCLLGHLSVGFDSQKGLEMVPSLSYLKKKDDIVSNTSLSMSLSSNYGLNEVELRRRSAIQDNSKHQLRNNTNGTGFSFSSPSFVPSSALRTAGRNFTVGLVYGTATAGTFTEQFNAEGSFATTYIPHADRVHNASAYGYLYADQQPALGSGLMDFNRDKDHPVSRRTPYVPMPVFTYDPLIIKGQGTGGFVRPYRSDIGILTEEESRSESHGGEVTAEVGVGVPNWKVGADVGYTYAGSHAGSWRHGAGAITDATGYSPLTGPHPGTTDLRFQPRGTDIPLYEPFYFKAAGERTASAPGQWDHIQGEAPVRFDLRQTFETDDSFIPITNAEPVVRNQISSTAPYGIPRAKNKRDEREKRVQSIEYRTKAQIVADPAYDTRAYNLYPANELPDDPANELLEDADNGSQFNYGSMPQDHHIGELSVLDPDGTRHIYGLPAYNTSQKEVVFAMEDPHTPGGGQIGEYDDAPIAKWPLYPLAPHWPVTPADLRENENGEDHYYSSTQLPPYAHSYLLTSVVSHDYVDLTGNGPSPDDLGYYAKFNYTELVDDEGDPVEENWRSPYRGVHYIKGYCSNERDDKGSYTYGTKKVYYLHSIETKTHVALFRTSARNDGKGAHDEGNADLTQFGVSQQKLDRIDLYSRNDLGRILKSVLFEYDYDLCAGTPNCGSGSGKKLTLKQVHFEHMGNPKGALSPYIFTYGADQPYSAVQVDRWGNYKPAGTWSQDHPYVDQARESDASRDDDASAWCLRTIQLPSGGTINVEYESDDYVFVQDKPAMQMFQITGTSEMDVDTHSDEGSLKRDFRRIYVDLGRQYNDPAAVMNACIEGVQDVYFKTWQRIKRKPLGDEGAAPAMDYVEGYAKVVAGSGGADGEHPRHAYFEVQEQDYGIGPKKVHPFRLAGWQYLRYERPDLQTPPNDVVNNSVVGTSLIAAVNLMLSSVRMVMGYYNMAAIQGWNREMILDDEDPDYKPSFVRLNTPAGASWNDGEEVGTTHGKFGGGHRVKRITISDEWEEGANTYGKSYEYTTTLDDGRVVSSGVAEYEPLLGGEEIALRKPVWYNGSDARISFRNPDAFLEEPFGEALFPGANVGYSRVVVRDLLDEDVTLAGNGVTVHEFYTARDFPVRVEHTDLDYAHFAPPPIPIPLIGGISFNNHGYSQGFAVHLNDMHGKLKAVSTYPTCEGSLDVAKTRTFYRYNTEPGQPKRLSDVANVLTDHFIHEVAKLGTTTEFYVDLREHSSEAVASKINLNLQGTPLPFPFGIPGFEYSKSMFRSVVTTKVVHKLGILGEVVNEVDGSRATTQTLLYDALTGEPLLSVVNNPFEDPVYTYKYAAHMAYEGMSGAYKNWGAEVGLTPTGTPGQYLPSNAFDPDTYFHLGDEVVDAGNGDHYWVTDVQTAGIILRNASNTTVTGVSYVRIARSGRRNMQSVQNGSIVSLRDPSILPMPDVFHQFNAQVLGHSFDDDTYEGLPSQLSQIEYGKCGTTELGPYEMDVKLTNLISINGHSSTTVNGVSGPLTEYLLGGANIVFDHASIPGSPGCKPVLLLSDPSTDPPNFPDLVGTMYNINDILIVGMTGVTVENAEFGFLEEVDLLIDGGTHHATGFWWDPDRCFPRCENVLHADATEYADNWTYDYADVGDPVGESNTPLTSAALNPYRYGKQGVWRPLRNHLYQVDRLNTEGPLTHVNKDGEYERFVRFDFADPTYNPEYRWVRREEMTRYSPYGFALESFDANKIFSSVLYGYDNSQVVAKAGNASYYEVAFDGFEDHPTNNSYVPGHGHLALSASGGPITINDAVAHTGARSARIPGGQYLAMGTTVENSVLTNWVPTAGERYTISAWVHTEDPTTVPSIQVLNTITTSSLVPTGEQFEDAAIEGWRKVTATFTMPGSGTTIEARFMTSGGTNTYLHWDDIRIEPADAAMTTYVYDRDLHWLKAELDDRNYATFYNYDEEGTLVQVKKETERGVMTLRTTRKNVNQLP